MKTPEEMADEYLEQDEIACDAINHAAEHLVKAGFLAGYKAGFEIGCMKGSMAMQWTLDSDHHLTPLVDHDKLVKVLIKKELRKK